MSCTGQVLPFTIPEPLGLTSFLAQDIKPNNLLYTTNGVLKLADFGLARNFGEPGEVRMTAQVITRWYRPPELFFGARSYSSAVDVFSLGLVFAELIKRVPLLAGDSDVGQLQLIARTLGTPTESNWPGVSKLPSYVIPNADDVKPEADRAFYRMNFFSISQSGQDLMRFMLRLDPRKRISCRQALESEWFKEEPLPTKPENLPIKKDKEALEKVGQDLKRRAGFDERMDGGDLDVGNRGSKVARRLDFGAM